MYFIVFVVYIYGRVVVYCGNCLLLYCYASNMCFTIQTIIQTYPFYQCKRVALIGRRDRLSFHRVRHSIGLMCSLYLHEDLER